MIYLEDEEIENALFENREEALVPIEITERNGEIEIITFEKTEKIAHEFEEKFIKSPFSREATEFLDSKLRNLASQWGYFVDDLNEGHILTFVCDKVNETLILPNTKMIKSANGYENLTEYEFEPLPENGEECYFVVLEGNKIVSVCEMNTDGVFCGATEINVYTNPLYRGKGYGSSCVSAMSDYLLKRDKKVAYTVQKDNLASISLAQKCGFVKIAQTYFYICYRND